MIHSLTHCYSSLHNLHNLKIKLIINTNKQEMNESWVNLKASNTDFLNEKGVNQGHNWTIHWVKEDSLNNREENHWFTVMTKMIHWLKWQRSDSSFTTFTGVLKTRQKIYIWSNSNIKSWGRLWICTEMAQSCKWTEATIHFSDSVKKKKNCSWTKLFYQPGRVNKCCAVVTFSAWALLFILHNLNAGFYVLRTFYTHEKSQL